MLSAEQANWKSKKKHAWGRVCQTKPNTKWHQEKWVSEHDENRNKNEADKKSQLIRWQRGGDEVVLYNVYNVIKYDHISGVIAVTKWHRDITKVAKLFSKRQKRDLIFVWFVVRATQQITCEKRKAIDQRVFPAKRKRKKLLCNISRQKSCLLISDGQWNEMGKSSMISKKKRIPFHRNSFCSVARKSFIVSTRLPGVECRQDKITYEFGMKIKIREK